MNRFSIFNDITGLKRVNWPFIKGIKFLYKYFLFSSPEKTYLIPNVTALLSTNKSSFDILPKDEWKVKMITRWKSLENLSHEKGRNFYLYVPSEEAEEFRYLIEQHQIEAIVCSSFIAAMNN